MQQIAQYLFSYAIGIISAMDIHSMNFNEPNVYGW